MKKILFIIAMLSQATCLLAQQDSTLQLIKIIEGDIVDFTVDNLGNILLVNKDYQLKKVGPAGDSIAVFNDVRRYGKLYSIDASNPLKLLLYYRDFGTVVILDRMLNARNTIDVRKQNILQARAIAQSYDNGIWIYDELEARLKKLNDDGKVVEATTDFRLLFDVLPTPTDIVDQNKFVYLYDPQRGLYIFDYYGSLKNKIALLGWSDFQVVDKFLFGRKHNTLQKYQPGTMLLQETVLPPIVNNVKKFRLAINRLYCLQEGNVYIYALQ